MKQTAQATGRAALVLVASVVGAGFASGREVLRFFTAFGAWSWVGCLIGAASIAGLSIAAGLLANRLGAHDLLSLCRKALPGWGGQAAAGIYAVMLAVTAGAMLSAMGELAALSLPIVPAYQVGFVLSLLVAALLTQRGLGALAAVGGWLIPACCVLYALLLRNPSLPTEPVATPPDAWRTLPLGFAYAAMNTALGCGVMLEGGRGQGKRRLVQSGALAGGLLLLLLLAANAVMLPHAAALIGEPLPMVRLARALGAPGYWMCIVVLSLAVMTTLVALLRGLRQMIAQVVPGRWSLPVAIAPPLLAALGGFEAIVGRVYPLLGVVCTLLFLAILLRPLTPAGAPRASSANASAPDGKCHTRAAHPSPR
ncbi:MAG: hypothetical protein LBN04_06250 [Oscillospiraceae bacterium]|jgi:uncharacterized membrane protein YkvI|nr:hypothetical protein [Oscillospiraceae bacterium]